MSHYWRHFLMGAGGVAVITFAAQRGFLGTTVRDLVTRITSAEVVKGVNF